MHFLIPRFPRRERDANSQRVTIRHLYISGGHNYFGHHGQPPGDHSCIEIAEVECVAGRGLRGDRFFDYKDNYKGQITFFSRDLFQSMCDALKIHDRSPAVLRRNAIVEGVELNSLIGREFEVQGIRFLGMAECSPCYWMNSAFGAGAEKFLQGRGGLRAKILTNGILRAENQ